MKLQTTWAMPLLKDFTPTQPKPPSPLPVVSVDEIPEKLVQEIDYCAFIEQLKQGPMVVGRHV